MLLVAVGVGRLAEFILETDYSSRRIIRLDLNLETDHSSKTNFPSVSTS